MWRGAQALSCGSTCRAVAKAEAGLQAAEARIAEGEETEANLQRELRIAELAVVDLEEVERHNKALQERLDESRAEHGQLANYKQVRVVSLG